MSGFDQLSNAIRMQSSLGQNTLSQPRFAEISSYDDSTHGVKVMIQPENQESGWMRLGAIGVGNGSGVAVGPNVGDMVLVVFAEGDFDSGNIIGRFFSTSNQAIPVPSGEVWMVHKTGSFMKMLTNGDIDFNTTGNLNSTVAGNMTSTVAGDMTATVSGAATIRSVAASVVASVSAAIMAPSITLGASGQTLKSFITDAFISLFNSHTHLINAVGSQTNTTLQQMSAAAHATSTVKGG